MLSRAKEAKKQELESFKTVKVERAHDWTGGRISFDAVFDNKVKIYGMTYIEGKRKDGTAYDFISFPQQKGKDGNYYNHVYLAMTEELKASCIKQLAVLLDVTTNN